MLYGRWLAAALLPISVAACAHGAGGPAASGPAPWPAEGPEVQQEVETSGASWSVLDVSPSSRHKPGRAPKAWSSWAVSHPASEAREPERVVCVAEPDLLE